MFAALFEVDYELMRNLTHAWAQGLKTRLNTLEGKVFDLKVGDNVHQISFKVENDEITLNLHNPGGFDDKLITMPKLRLNARSHFLPDSMTLDGKVEDFYPEVENAMGCTLSEGSSDLESAQIMAEINKIGFLKFIGVLT
jgi:hypothetical protein